MSVTLKCSNYLNSAIRRRLGNDEVHKCFFLSVQYLFSLTEYKELWPKSGHILSGFDILGAPLESLLWL